MHSGPTAMLVKRLWHDVSSVVVRLFVVRNGCIVAKRYEIWLGCY